MKRFLLSVLLSFVLIVLYLVAAGVVVQVFSEDPNNLDASLVAMVDVPMRLPKYVYYYFFPPTIADYSTNPSDIIGTKLLLAVGMFGMNVLLYSIPIYFLLRFASRFRSNREPDFEGSIQDSQPPPPPKFE